MENFKENKDIQLTNKKALTDEEKALREKELENEIQLMNFKRSLGSVRTSLKVKKDCLSRL